MSPAWLATITGVAVAAAGFVGWGVRWLWRIFQRTSHFLDDYFGQPARDGLPARPGVMARLGRHENLLHELIAETQPNGGSSLRDVVTSTAADVAAIKDEQARLREQIERRTAEPEGGE